MSMPAAYPNDDRRQLLSPAGDSRKPLHFMSLDSLRRAAERRGRTRRHGQRITRGPGALLALAPLLLQVVAVDVEIDLHLVAGAVVEMADEALLVLDDDALHFLLRGQRIIAREIGGQPAGLLLGEIGERGKRLGKRH